MHAQGVPLGMFSRCCYCFLAYADEPRNIWPTVLTFCVFVSLTSRTFFKLKKLFILASAMPLLYIISLLPKILRPPLHQKAGCLTTYLAYERQPRSLVPPLSNRGVYSGVPQGLALVPTLFFLSAASHCEGGWWTVETRRREFIPLCGPF